MCGSFCRLVGCGRWWLGGCGLLTMGGVGGGNCGGGGQSCGRVVLTLLGVFNPAHCATLRRVVPGGTVFVPPYLICTLWKPCGLHKLLGNLFMSTLWDGGGGGWWCGVGGSWLGRLVVVGGGVLVWTGGCLVVV